MQRQATRHIPQVVGSNIRIARAEADLTQHELALQVGTQGFQVSRWELGIHRPKDDMLARLADALDKDVAWFYVDREPQGAAA